MFVSSFQGEDDVDLRVRVQIDPDGDADADGTARLRPDGSRQPLKLVATGATAACADTNGNRITGLTGLQVEFAERRSGRPAVATITPDVEIEEPGRHRGFVEIDPDGLSGVVEISVRGLERR